MQGVFGGLPWAALAFAILYLQLLGLSDLLASGIVACAMVSAAAGAIMLKHGTFMDPSTLCPHLTPSVHTRTHSTSKNYRFQTQLEPTRAHLWLHAGGFLGGYVGDWAAKRWPRHGRIAVAQFSVGVGIPLAVLLFKVHQFEHDLAEYNKNTHYDTRVRVPNNVCLHCSRSETLRATPHLKR